MGTVKGNQVFDSLLGDSSIQDLLNSQSSIFSGVSETAATSLANLDLSAGYNNFIESIYSMRDSIPAEDQDLIVAAISDSGIPFANILSRQVESAFNGELNSGSVGGVKFVIMTML